MEYVDNSAQLDYYESQNVNYSYSRSLNRNPDIKEVWYGNEVMLPIGDQLITLSTSNEYYNDGSQGFSGQNRLRFLTEKEENLFKIALRKTGRFLD